MKSKVVNGFEIFNFDGKSVRSRIIDGQPWFVLKDVCDVLDLDNPSYVAKRLDDDERASFKLGRQGEAIVINESGLYDVIIRSDKQGAKRFRRWITHEVLPSIRKHGEYVLDTKRWQVLRVLAARHFNIQNMVLDDHSFRARMRRHQIKGVLADEADMLNLVIFQKTAKEWREENPDKKGNMRDYATDDELLMLLVVEIVNSALLSVDVPADIRVKKLSTFVDAYFSLLELYKERKMVGPGTWTQRLLDSQIDEVEE